MSKERTNISIDENLKKRAKKFANETHRSLSGLIEMGLERILEENVTESDQDNGGEANSGR